MPSYEPPKRGVEHIFGIALVARAIGDFKENPTIAAGDFQVSKDFGAFANLTTLPTVSPAGGRQVKITLSATEMTADNVCVIWVDQAGAEWMDGYTNIPTVANQVDDLFTTVLADSVPSDGTRPSLTQAIYEIRQFLHERAVSGTTLTVKKVDGSTTLETFTLDSATTPTSITRAT
jgi:hypothetical protein